MSSWQLSEIRVRFFIVFIYELKIINKTIHFLLVGLGTGPSGAFSEDVTIMPTYKGIEFTCEMLIYNVCYSSTRLSVDIETASSVYWPKGVSKQLIISE